MTDLIEITPNGEWRFHNWDLHDTVEDNILNLLGRNTTAREVMFGTTSRPMTYSTSSSQKINLFGTLLLNVEVQEVYSGFSLQPRLEREEARGPILITLRGYQTAWLESQR